MPTPSLLIVPARFKTGTLYSQIPVPVAPSTSSVGDFNVTRATTARRFGPDGLIASVASGIPRLDYYTSGGVTGCPALLVEPSAQNLARHSENWTSTNNWQLSDGSGRVTVVNATSGTTSPDGTSTANAITPTSGNIQHFLYSNSSGSITYVSGTIYTFSAFFKKGAGDSGRYVQVLTVGGSRFNNPYANFDLELGTTLTVSGSTSDANRVSRIQNYGNGWYRCILTATCSDSGSSSVGFGAALLTGDTNARLGASFAGNTSDYIFGWGAQLETGSVATSYIPTTTAAVTRNADVISVSGAVSGSIGQTEGTIYLEVDAPRPSQQVFAIGTGATNSIHVYKLSNGAYKVTINGQSNSVDLQEQDAKTGFVKIAIAYKSGESALVVNGGIPITSASSLTFGALTSVNFFGTYQAALPFRVRAVALYNTRLTNAEMQSLTTL